MKVVVMSQRAVLDGAAEGADAIISIRGTAPDETVRDLDLACHQAVLGDVDGVLRLTFEDTGIPTYGLYTGPTMNDVVTAIDFGRRVRDQHPEGMLAVHCLHGRSRSTAIALALIADTLGPGREDDAVRLLLAQDAESRMHPNPLIVSMADAALLRLGALDEALSAACPRYVTWRAFWAEARLDPEGHWAKTRKAKFRRREER
ncbi:hypothetical protein CRT60_00905 [Azospirillum palustre]|uniref:Protein tyrosine phosphatase n=1 Tax=Azospirillum palustre TaxID=2044885 RepID=A0A2B8BD00_9PROT|nr:hypothetical protein [Azospirillum palustre]PGH59224.1 hypothetical protein CRT60_00905 [Azospirillum palustre]